MDDFISSETFLGEGLVDLKINWVKLSNWMKSQSIVKWLVVDQFES